MVLEALVNSLQSTTPTCRHANVSYDYRVQDIEKYNWCTVPDSGSDAVLFISTALLASCICSGQLSALYILLLGAEASRRHFILLCHIEAPVSLRTNIMILSLLSYKEARLSTAWRFIEISFLKANMALIQGFIKEIPWPNHIQNKRHILPPDSGVLLTGGMCQGIAFPVNLGRFGNSFALFLGVQPADIFLYVFLPPILFDAAVRIDFYVFKKVASLSSSTAVVCTLSY